MFSAILTVLATMRYTGSIYTYFLFTFVFHFLLFSGFRENRLFFDTFVGIFFWLGFWLKFSFTIAFLGGQFGEPVGNFSFTGPAFDLALNVSTLGAFGLLAASFLRKKFFAYKLPSKAAILPPLEALYLKYRVSAWIIFMLCVLLVTINNVYFGFYQKGLPPRTILPFGLSGVVSLALLFGLASISAVLLNSESKLKAPHYLPAVLAIFECFLSNVSMLSRGMVLNGSALLWGVFENARVRGMQLSRNFKITVITAFLGLFISSLFAVNYVREDAFGDSDAEAVTIRSGGDSVARIIRATRIDSFVNRWVGIEGMMSVTSYPGLGWDLWKMGWGEKYSSTGTSLYDRTIVADSPYVEEKMRTKHFITLPGIMAFLFYPGSLAFLFFAMCTAGLFAAFVEVCVYKLAGKNIILCSLLGQVIASRYAHFGYVPRQSYLLFGGVFIVVLAVSFSNMAVSAIPTADKK